MTQSDAILYLERLLLAAQKCRSNLMEVMEKAGGSESANNRVLINLNPWLFGEREIIVPLSRLITRAKQEHDLQPGEFYNFMTIVDCTTVLQIWPLVMDMEWSFPKPDIKWMSGWKAEIVP